MSTITLNTAPNTPAPGSLFSRFAHGVVSLLDLIHAASELSAKANSNQRITFEDLKRSGLI